VSELARVRDEPFRADNKLQISARPFMLAVDVVVDRNAERLGRIDDQPGHLDVGA
jgi:hypothetical protein